MGSAMEKTMAIDQLKVGQIHQSSVTITEDMIKRFAQATGDFNPVHLDEE
jgi:3-hydroxybutyryl-CoA dehydratase